MSKGNEPAFGGTAMTAFDGDSQFVVTSGLSKRQYFAGLAMQGVLARGNHGGINSVVAWSVDIADALLAELEKSP